MERDIRGSDEYRAAEGFLETVLGPGFGTISDVGEVRPSPDGRWIACGGSRLDGLEGHPVGTIAIVPAEGGALRQVTHGPNDDGDPRWSPDSSRLTFASDRAVKGRRQLYMLTSGAFEEAQPLPEVPGTIEYHEWSPNGSRILVGVAGLGAEQADALGSGTVGRKAEVLPGWVPEVRGAEETQEERRRLYVIDVASGRVRPLSDPPLNVWEARWAGDGAVVTVASEQGDEGAWYAAPLMIVDASSGSARVLAESDVQLGWAVGSPDGRTAAVIEARCSDRQVVAGALLLVDIDSGRRRSVDTSGTDISWTAWRADGRLFAIGLRGLDTVALDVDAEAGTAREVWTSPDAGTGWYPTGEPIGEDDGFVAARCSSSTPPRVVIVSEGHERELATTEHDGSRAMRDAAGLARRLTWTAPDGLEIQGLLNAPSGAGPFPLILLVHGGPVGATQDYFPGPSLGMLVSRGYAVLRPNPRGSGGRGRGFADLIVGDMGGDDALDDLAGIDMLVRDGIADPDRIGVMGGSYGGFMACWLPGIDPRFKAAVAISPVTDWVSQHYTSSLASWDAEFVGAEPDDLSGAFHERSPVMRSAQVSTPTLLTAGLKDRATPPGQAIEFWQALRLRGVESEVVLYPLEGHGVRAFPASIDLLARTVAWFERHMPPDTRSG